MVEKLTNAKESVFTVTFRRKVDIDDAVNVLQQVKKASDLKTNAAHLAKQMVTGQLVSITGYLTKAEEKLGRSLIIDLSQDHGKEFKQVDHRTIEELILQNVKYTLKK